MNVDLHYLAYYCDSEFRQLIYNSIISRVHEIQKTDDKYTVLEFLQDVINDGLIDANIETFNSALKCEKIYNMYHDQIAEEVYMYANSNKCVTVKSILPEYNTKDPLCFTLRNKQLSVWFCILMCVSEWLSLYNESCDKSKDQIDDGVILQ